MGKSTISMAMFNSYVSLPEGRSCYVSIVVFSKDLFFDRSRQVKSWVQTMNCSWIADEKTHGGGNKIPIISLFWVVYIIIIRDIVGQTLLIKLIVAYIIISYIPFYSFYIPTILIFPGYIPMNRHQSRL